MSANVTRSNIPVLVSRGPGAPPWPPDPGAFAWEAVRRRADYAEIDPTPTTTAYTYRSVTILEADDRALAWGLRFRRKPGAPVIDCPSLLGCGDRSPRHRRACRGDGPA